MTTLLFSVILALVADRLFPDRGGFRLWAWYGDWAESIEQRFNGGLQRQGLSALVLALVPMALAVLVTQFLLGEIARVLEVLFGVGLLYLCVGLFPLSRSAETVAAAIERNAVAEAATALQELTGKTTAERTDAGIAHAAVEAVLKQANAQVVAPVFWFLVLGPVGLVVQRMASILDRLWGHRDMRYSEFGWAAARFDDLINWVPARITALSYAIMGSFEDALYCWRKRSAMWSDINSGPLLASGFGALHMGSCQDESEEDAYGNRAVDPESLPGANDVRRALALVWRVMLFWFVIGVLMTGAHLFGWFSR